MVCRPLRNPFDTASCNDCRNRHERHTRSHGKRHLIRLLLPHQRQRSPTLRSSCLRRGTRRPIDCPYWRHIQSRRQHPSTNSRPCRSDSPPSQRQTHIHHIPPICRHRGSYRRPTTFYPAIILSIGATHQHSHILFGSHFIRNRMEASRRCKLSSHPSL